MDDNDHSECDKPKATCPVQFCGVRELSLGLVSQI
jgi:hypothetical protein